MTDNIIERVARCLSKEHMGDDAFWESWIPIAAKTIKTMRKPTTSMINAAGELVYCTSDITSGELHIAWRAMIDAALKSSPQ